MQLYDRPSLDELDGQRRAWEEGALRRAVERFPERYAEFSTLSGLPIEHVYTPGDVADADYAHDLGMPGEYPYTRGVHATMSARTACGPPACLPALARPRKPTQRYKYLLEQGNMGLSVAFDLATLMGYDTDAPEALGEFGHCGVAISSLADMEILFRWHSAGQSEHQHDDQQPRADDLGHVHRRRRKAGRADGKAARHAAKRHPQGVHRPKRVHLPARTVDAAGDRHD
jgi:hypothetical protein